MIQWRAFSVLRLARHDVEKCVDKKREKLKRLSAVYWSIRDGQRELGLSMGWVGLNIEICDFMLIVSSSRGDFIKPFKAQLLKLLHYAMQT